MTEAAALPSIRQRGLLSAAALVEACGLTPPQQAALLEANRAEWCGLPCGAVLRLQLMSDSALRSRLDPAIDMPDWRRFINGHVFFCVSQAQAAALRRYENTREQVVLRFASADLLAAGCLLKTCTFNNGAVDRSPPHRRRRRHFEDYRDIRGWQRTDPVREVAAVRNVPPAVGFTIVDP